MVPSEASQSAHDAGIRIASSVKEIKQIREVEPNAWVFQKGDLLVPLYDAEQNFAGEQTVNPYFKGFMKGAQKSSLYSVAGGTPNDLELAIVEDPKMPIVVVDGYATGDTVSGALGHPVIVALDSGNLDSVCRQMRKAYPNSPLIIAADNDQNLDKPNKKNVGLQKAEDAAKAHGGSVCAPEFPKGTSGSDWNDFAESQGDEKSDLVIQHEMEKAKIKAGMDAAKMRYYAHERMADAVDNPATSADNQFVSSERDKAHAAINAATRQETAIRSAVVNMRGQPETADMAVITKKQQDMAEDIKEARAEVLDGTNNSTEQDPNVNQSLSRRLFRKARGRRLFWRYRIPVSPNGAGSGKSTHSQIRRHLEEVCYSELSNERCLKVMLEWEKDACTQNAVDLGDVGNTS